MDSTAIFLFYIPLGILIILGMIMFARRSAETRYRERSHFPSYMRKDVLSKQGYKCAVCKKSAGVWDFDHIDGDRSNNDIKNCQALCPNCHAKKTRGMMDTAPDTSGRNLFWKYFLIILIITFIAIVAYNQLK